MMPAGIGTPGSKETKNGPGTAYMVHRDRHPLRGFVLVIIGIEKKLKGLFIIDQTGELMRIKALRPIGNECSDTATKQP